ncbi:hypothetical protein ACUNV4_20335 [Granulosicoccus sp. 3-233]|uniref:hypothetical protein n=1 Tax=Granulosicoccus sp. 3-233 TaxID=3417969 RepID=UPI003D3566FE
MPGPSLTHSQKIQRLLYTGCLLLVVLLCLIAFVWWSDQHSSRQTQAIAYSGQSLRIERPGFATIALTRQEDEQWRIVEPCPLPVNDQRLQPLLDALAPAAHGYASSEVDLDAAGLLDPAAVVYLDEQRLVLGGTDLSGERRYLQRGERVEFVPEWLLSMLNGGLSALAVLEVFPTGLDALSALSSPTDDMTLPALNLTADSLEQWRTLSAQQIVSWPLADSETAIAARHLEADIAGQRTPLTLHDFQHFLALRFENAACAYIMPRTSLPDSVFP